MTDQYLPNSDYHRLTRALASVEPDPVTGRVGPHQVSEVLGEIGGIWPASCLADSAEPQGSSLAAI